MGLPPPSTVVCFGPFQLDLKAGELDHNGRKIRLHQQPFQILKMLLEHPGEVVTREEIRTRLWPNNTIVEFDHSINAAINKLRLTLGDSAEEPRYVETLARRGYRFVAPVEWVGAGRVEDVTAGTPATDSRTGKKVSHYRVLEMLGGGGMGVVYRAEDIKLGRRVAVKFLAEELAENPAALERFEREARAASALEHPNICPVYEFGEHEGQPFIVMQLLEGQTLREQAALPPDTLLDLAIQIADGLEAAHRKGIIHRDIKPANIFITTQGQAKILDFGVVKLPQTLAVEADVPLTDSGLAVGTAAYMSPEQARGEELDARTDLFSFGAVLYEMATGRQAFAGATKAVVFDALLNRAVTSPVELNPELSPKLGEIIRRLLEKDRELRYPSAAELRRELLHLRRPAATEPSKPPRPRRQAVWVGIGVAILLALGLGYPWMRQQANRATALPERQLTANPPEDRVTAAAISPDGKHVAYKDQVGLFVRAIDTGEIRPVPLPPELRGLSFALLQWFPDGGKLLAEVAVSQGWALWVIPILGAAPPHLLYSLGDRPAISPDGRAIAFVTGEVATAGRELWVGGINGESPQKLAASQEYLGLGEPAWSPDGRWIAYFRVWGTPRNVAIEVLPAGGGQARTLVPASSLPRTYYQPRGAMSWSPDWRLVFAITADADIGHTAENGAGTLWALPVEPTRCEARGKPERRPQWMDWRAGNLTLTTDGKRLAFLKVRSQTDVYLGELGRGGTMEAPRRLTLDDRGSQLDAWTQDSQAILFTSNRNGKYEIFRGALKEPVPQTIVESSGHAFTAKLSPDWAWLLYWVAPITPADPRPGRLMRRHVAGGSPETVLEAPDNNLLDFKCPPTPGSACVLSQREGREMVFYALDPLRGKGDRIAHIEVKTDISSGSAATDWSVSPDGSRIALVDAQPHIKVFSRSDGTWHEIPVGPAWGPLNSIAWAPDGKSFYTISRLPDSYNILHVTATGLVAALFRKGQDQLLQGLQPSPDGKHLAFNTETYDSNVWLIENF